MLRNQLQRGIEIFCEEGGRSLVGKSSSFLKRKVIDWYWKLKGTKSLRVGQTSAVFGASKPSARKTAENHCQREEEILNDIIEELNSDDVFWDIGANIGVFSCFAAQVVSNGEVVSFEPFPPNVEQLEENLSYNHGGGTITIQNIALSDSQGEIEFTSTKGSDNITAKSSIDPSGDSITVDSFQGDKLVSTKGVSTPDIIKIDVEGVEPLVLRGLENTLQDHCRVLFCEIHPEESKANHNIREYGETVESMIENVERMGFCLNYKLKRGNEIHIKATK